MNLPVDHAERLARARLSVEGLSIGDAFGKQFFDPPNAALLQTRTVLEGIWQYTDDTEMALAVAQVRKFHNQK